MVLASRNKRAVELTAAIPMAIAVIAARTSIKGGVDPRHRRTSPQTVEYDCNMSISSKHSERKQQRRGILLPGLCYACYNLSKLEVNVQETRHELC